MATKIHYQILETRLEQKKTNRHSNQDESSNGDFSDEDMNFDSLVVETFEDEHDDGTNDQTTNSQTGFLSEEEEDDSSNDEEREIDRMLFEDDFSSRRNSPAAVRVYTIEDYEKMTDSEIMSLQMEELKALRKKELALEEEEEEEEEKNNRSSDDSEDETNTENLSDSDNEGERKRKRRKTKKTHQEKPTKNAKSTYYKAYLPADDYRFKKLNELDMLQEQKNGETFCQICLLRNSVSNNSLILSTYDSIMNIYDLVSFEKDDREIYPEIIRQYNQKLYEPLTKRGIVCDRLTEGHLRRHFRRNGGCNNTLPSLLLKTIKSYKSNLKEVEGNLFFVNLETGSRQIDYRNSAVYNSFNNNMIKFSIMAHQYNQNSGTCGAIGGGGTGIGLTTSNRGGSTTSSNGNSARGRPNKKQDESSNAKNGSTNGGNAKLRDLPNFVLRKRKEGFDFYQE